MRITIFLFFLGICNHRPKYIALNIYIFQYILSTTECIMLSHNTLTQNSNTSLKTHAKFGTRPHGSSLRVTLTSGPLTGIPMSELSLPRSNNENFREIKLWQHKIHRKGIGTKSSHILHLHAKNRKGLQSIFLHRKKRDSHLGRLVTFSARMRGDTVDSRQDWNF